MKELDKLNSQSRRASNAMCVFIVVNTASIQLIPATLIALRASFSSSAPSEIVVPVWITSVCALAVGVTAAKLMEKRS